MSESRPATNDEVSSLRDLRLDLLRLHKALLDAERIRYERTHGRVETGSALLQIVANNPAFGWLRPLTALIVAFDEELDAKEPLSAAGARELLDEARTLLAPDESGEDFQRNYNRVIQADPDALFTHTEVVRFLGRG
ncbi:MAG: hypothetical protein ACT4P7_05100 [Gemmatimonadaceae bacterium]